MADGTEQLPTPQTASERQVIPGYWVYGAQRPPLWEQEYDKYGNPLKPCPNEPGGPIIPQENVSQADTSLKVPHDRHGPIKSGTVFVEPPYDDKPATDEPSVPPVVNLQERVESLQRQLDGLRAWAYEVNKLLHQRQPIQEGDLSPQLLYP